MPPLECLMSVNVQMSYTSNESIKKQTIRKMRLRYKKNISKTHLPAEGVTVGFVTSDALHVLGPKYPTGQVNKKKYETIF